jgi:hypothetical protein
MMKKFEYMYSEKWDLFKSEEELSPNNGQDHIKFLNEKGNEGWKLVSVLRDLKNNRTKIYYFKREIK